MEAIVESKWLSNFYFTLFYFILLFKYFEFNILFFEWFRYLGLFFGKGNLLTIYLHILKIFHFKEMLI